MGTWNHDRTRYSPSPDPVRTSRDDDMHVRAAREALTRPESFAYHGDLPLFDSWGITFTQTRDSDTVERSNYRSVLKHLQEVAEYHVDDVATLVDEISCSHWAHGWAEHIVIRVLKDEGGEVTADNITNVFKVAADIAVFLSEESSIFNEADHSEVESEEHYEVWTNCRWPDFKSGATVDRADFSGPYRAIRDEQDYLDAMDDHADEIYSQVADYTPECDPSTWDDDEIMIGVARVAEELAHAEDAARVPVAWWHEGPDRIHDDGVFLELDTHAHLHGGYVHTIDRHALRVALKLSKSAHTIAHDRDVLARHNLLGNKEN